jgi:O-antigen/teichoic acid export membrane protein
LVNPSSPAPRRFGPGTVSRDAAWSFGYIGVIRVGTAALSVVVAHLLGPSGAGALGVALQVTALGALVATFNLPMGLTRQLAGTSDPELRSRQLRSSAGLVLPIGALVGAAISLGAAPLAERVYHDPSLTNTLRVCGPLAFATAGYAWMEGGLQGLRLFGALARWGAGVAVLDLLLVLPASVAGVPGLLLARAGVRLVALLAGAWFWIRHHVRWPQRATSPSAFPVTIERDPLLPILAFAGPTFLASLLTMGGLTLLRVLVIRRAGLEPAGHLQAADSLAQALQFIPLAATAALMPAVSREGERGNAGFAGILERGLAQVTGLHLAACLAAMAIVPSLVVIAFGRDFAASRPVFILLAAAYGISGPSMVFGAAILGRGEVWLGSVLNAIWAASTLVAFSTGIAGAGAAGAAAAIAIGYLVLLSVCIVILPAIWKVSRRGLLAPVIVAPLALGAGAALTLSPRVHPLLAATGCLALAAAALWNWNLRTPRAATETVRA